MSPKENANQQHVLNLKTDFFLAKLIVSFFVLQPCRPTHFSWLGKCNTNNISSSTTATTTQKYRQYLHEINSVTGKSPKISVKVMENSIKFKIWWFKKAKYMFKSDEVCN